MNSLATWLGMLYPREPEDGASQAVSVALDGVAEVGIGRGHDRAGVRALGAAWNLSQRVGHFPVFPTLRPRGAGSGKSDG